MRTRSGRLRFEPAVDRASDREPTAPMVQRVAAFTIDWLLHVAVAVGVFVAAKHSATLSDLPTVWAALAWLAVSFVHRAVVQSIVQTTVGKAVFGLVIINREGARPSFGRLVGAWLGGLFVTLTAWGNAPGPEFEALRARA